MEPSASRNQSDNEVIEQRLKELQDELQTKRARRMQSKNQREKSLKQKSEEAEAYLRHLNEEIHSAHQEVIHIDELTSVAKASQGKTSQRSFIWIDPISPISINL